MVFESEEALLSLYPERAGRRRSFASWMVLPLEMKGRILGGLVIAFAQPRTLAIARRTLATALARQCAQALNAHAFMKASMAARQTADSPRGAANGSWKRVISLPVLSITRQPSENLRSRRPSRHLVHYRHGERRWDGGAVGVGAP